jgi:hypothetical protein
MPPARRSRASPPLHPTRPAATALPHRATGARPHADSASVPTASRRDSGLDDRPRPRFGCPPKRAASLAGRRSGTRSRRQESCRLSLARLRRVSAFWSSGGWPPAREENADWQKRHPPTSPPTTPRAQKRSRVLLSTAQSIGLASPCSTKPFHCSVKMKIAPTRAFVIRGTRKPNPRFRRSGNPPHFPSVALAPRAAGRCGSGYAGPRFGRPAPAFRRGRDSAEHFHNLQGHLSIRTLFPSLSRQHPSAPERPAHQSPALRCCRLVPP